MPRPSWLALPGPLPRVAQPSFQARNPLLLGGCAAALRGADRHAISVSAPRRLELARVSFELQPILFIPYL
jgi:hypothetical protein